MGQPYGKAAAGVEPVAIKTTGQGRSYIVNMYYISKLKGSFSKKKLTTLSVTSIIQEYLVL